MKLIIAFLFVVICVVNAQYGDHHHKHLEEYVDYQAHPHYNYHYGVHDPKHHDVHDQWETRDGHKTKGSYSLQQPDGRKRIVEYEADKHGIHYNVKYEGHAIHEEGHSHGGHKGHSVSNQYHHSASNFAGHVEGHHGGDGGGHGHGGNGGGDGGHGHGHIQVASHHGHGGDGGGDGGHGHGQATSYATHITHHSHGHGHGHGGHH